MRDPSSNISVTVKGGTRVAHTTLKRRNGRITSQLDRTRISGPTLERPRPAPIAVVENHDPDSSSHYPSSPFDSSFISSPVENIFSMDDLDPVSNHPPDNHFHHHFGVQHIQNKRQQNNSESYHGSEALCKKQKVRILNLNAN